ncbi:unnamed protein product [Acanthosepion pharaonis]|uniref:Helitron helicase-like domain-containing protein n=1 Tax=Acanthosepion pharaonis TaxID=158019 RepID=A0A812CX44_ACAPH|nr:unnamed protein product [Sepia pharaonis]
MYTYLSIYLSIYLFIIYSSIYLFIYVYFISIYLSIYLYIYLSVCLSNYLSISANSERPSSHEWAASQMHHRSRQLFHQFIVDMAAKMESERLCYIKLNQTKLRCDSYIHFRDALRNDADPRNIFKMCILPATFTGSPRYMHARTQDTMTYVRMYGRPDLFITFTYNPKWYAIAKELIPGQSAYDRPDLIARVYHLKLGKLMDVITKGQFFGAVCCRMHTIE